MEGRSRRNNVRFDGPTEDPKETWDVCEGKVHNVLLNNPSSNIEDSHRFGKRRGSRPRTTVYKFLRFKDKQKILQNVKNIYIRGFCSNTVKLWRSLWEKVL